MFTDETTVQNKSSNPNRYIFRHPHEKYNQDLVNRTDHVKPTLSDMYWAGIRLDDHTNLVLMERDSNSPRQGYSNVSYRKALDEGFLPLHHRDNIYQHDNSRVHTAKESTAWFLRHAAFFIEWPPFSPDLNPIENVWNLLKQKLRKMFPYLGDLNDNAVDRAEFRRCIQAAWKALDQSKIRSIVQSMPARVRAVQRARGWYTKY